MTNTAIKRLVSCCNRLVHARRAVPWNSCACARSISGFLAAKKSYEDFSQISKQCLILKKIRSRQSIVRRISISYKASAQLNKAPIWIQDWGDEPYIEVPMYNVCSNIYINYCSQLQTIGRCVHCAPAVSAPVGQIQIENDNWLICRKWGKLLMTRRSNAVSLRNLLPIVTVASQIRGLFRRNGTYNIISSVRCAKNQHLSNWGFFRHFFGHTFTPNLLFPFS